MAGRPEERGEAARAAGSARFQNVNTHSREQAARQRTDTSVEADEERHTSNRVGNAVNTRNKKIIRKGLRKKEK